MDQLSPEGFAEAMRFARKQGVTLFEAERELFDLTHAEIGRHVALKWSFPEPIAEAIAHHHGPPESGQWNNLSAVVHIADMITRPSNLALGTWDMEIDEQALGILNKTLEVVESMVSHLSNEFEKTNFVDALVA